MMLEEIKNKEFTQLGRACHLKGDFSLSGIIRIASQMAGTLRTQNEESVITIERDGHYNGQIDCHDIEIFGSFEGKLNSKGRVIIRPSATVKGEIVAESLTIFPGASVNIDGSTH